jgi:DNA-binding Xre family transcriptional regulator
MPTNYKDMIRPLPEFKKRLMYVRIVEKDHNLLEAVAESGVSNTTITKAESGEPIRFEKYKALCTYAKLDYTKYIES